MNLDYIEVIEKIFDRHRAHVQEKVLGDHRILHLNFGEIEIGIDEGLLGRYYIKNIEEDNECILGFSDNRFSLEESYASKIEAYLESIKLMDHPNIINTTDKIVESRFLSSTWKEYA